MGFFSPREKINVGTSVSRVIEDKVIADPGKIGVIKAILKRGNIAEHLTEELSASIGTRAERMYEYGQRGYAFGLPSGEIFTSSQGQPQIKAVLDAMTGQDVQIDYNRLGPANTLHMGWMKIVSELGYDPKTNQLTALTAAKGIPVYLTDMIVVIPSNKIGKLSPQALEQWGNAPSTGKNPFYFEFEGLLARMMPHTPVRASDTAPNEQVLIKYVWGYPATPFDPYTGEWGSEATMYEDSLSLDIHVDDPQADYFHVKYSIADQSYYWMYKLGSGAYPSLDALFNSPPVATGEFFPITYFRLNKTPLNNNRASPEYITSKKLIKYLGINYDQLIDSINQNPDINDVEQAMIMMAVPANTSNQLEQRYLFEFFDQLRANQSNTFTSYNAGEITSKLLDWARNIFADTIVIQDRAFKMAVSNGGIYKRRVGGSIGPRGSFSSTTGVKYGSYRVTQSGDNGAEYDEPISIYSHYYRKQVSATMFDEIEVINLRTTYKVFEQFESFGDETDDILLIPLDRTVTQYYSTAHKNELFSRSLHYVFNSKTISYTYWYQSGLFQFVILAIALALALYSAGQSLAAAAAALAAGSTMAAVVLSILISVLKTIAISLAISYIATQVGPEVAIALALLAAAYGLAGDGLSNLPSLPFADSLLSAASSMVSAVGEYYTKEIQGIQEAFSELALEEQKTSALISEAQDLLADNQLLSPLTIIGESADDYYRRTMYSGNVGIVAVNSIETFYERALALPTLADSFGNMLS